MYIDDLPAKYVALVLWTVFAICWVAYDVLFWIRMHLSSRMGKVNPFAYYLTTAVTVYSSFAAVYSIDVFAVHPSENFFMHTLPFSALVVSVSLVGVRNSLYGLATGRFRRASDSPGVKTAKVVLVYAYLVVFISMSLMKVVFQYRGIVERAPPPMWIGKLNDQLWTVCALVVPFLFDIIGMACMKDLLTSVSIDFAHANDD